MARNRRRLTRRETAYFSLRGLAALGVVVSATVLPHGLPAAVLCIACGALAVLTCVGVMAGGPGEQSGSAPFQRAYDRVRAPQGDWPPYDPAKVVEGELVD
ncbi:MAG TPA: hypothetical protein VFR07_07130 [Mycobacteriales bacterium]|nr:hypothetical protein [Mycobacteriales bacterium]